MKFDASPSGDEILSDARETARQAARRAGLPLGEWLKSAVLESASQAGIVPELSDDDRLGRAPDLRASRREPRVSDGPSTRIGGFDIDRAIAEITARRGVLDAERVAKPPAAAPRPEPQHAAGAVQDFSGLESQLRKIAEQLETLRRPDVEQAVDVLRSDLKEIGRTLAETVPQRVVEKIEQEIQALDRRIAENRRAGPDSAALSGIERGLAEVRHALLNPTPTESPAGLDEALANLARKMDLVVVQSDPVSVQRLESSVAALRDFSARVASNEAVSRLAGEVRSLTKKVEEMTHGAAETASGGVALEHLEDRIVKLMERLDVSDSRFSKLDGIERGLADLLVHVEDLRAGAGRRLPAERGADADFMPAAPASAPKSVAAPGIQPAIDPGLSVDQRIEAASPRRTADAAARVAAPEAALGDVRPAGDAEPTGRSSFIAAARRAAQAATQERPVRVEAVPVQKKRDVSLGSKPAYRMKALIVAASVLAIVIGSLVVASKFFNFAKVANTQQYTARIAAQDQASNAVDQADDEEEIAAGSADSAGASDPPVLFSPATPASGNIAAAPALDLTNPQSILNTATLAAGRKAPADITGSIPHLPTSGQPVAPPIPMLPSIGDQAALPGGKLPAAIGGPALRTAAANGDPAASYEIGIRYVEGHGVPVNMQEAARWLERAAGKGLVPAQFRLASLLEKGTGVPKDLARARTLYLAAAGKGNAKAMHNLAVLYAEGGAGKPDYAAAARWFHKAADHGVADSQYNLAVLYARGLGVEKSYSESYKWFALAADKGDREAGKKRDEIAGRLEPKALAAARQAVKAWTAEPQPSEAIRVSPPPGGWDG